MANQDVKVSALQSASTLSTEDLALATVVDELSETGYTSKKITEGAKASQYLEAFTFANLNTSAKTIVGAINEAATTGAGDFPIHINNSTIAETAGEVIDAMADGLKPYVIWTNNAQSNYTFTYVLAAVWNPDANTETLIFGCPITGAVRTIHVFIDPAARTYRSSIQIVDYTIPQINDASTSSSAVWSAQKINAELADKAEIADTVVSTTSAWSSSRIASFLPTDTASGAVANFPDGADGVPVDSLVVNIEPVQAGTGDPSPSNVRPISGRSEINVTRAGKNLFNKDTITANAWLTTDTGIVEVSNGYSVSDYIKVWAGIPVFIPNRKTSRTWFYDENKVPTEYLNQSSAQTYTPSANGFLRMTMLTSGTAPIDINTFQVELGTTSTDYKPYTTPTEAEIPLGQTIYGGNAEVVGGICEETYGIVDLGSLSWTKSSSGNKYHAVLPTPYEYERDIDMKCEIFACDGFGQGGERGYYPTVDNSFRYYWGQAVTPAYEIYVLCESATTMSEFETIVEGKKLVFPLATPVEIALTPEQINTLEGVNNIWADTGDTAVEYRADVQLYIDKKLASLSNNRGLSLSKSEPEEVKEEVKEEQEGGNNER